MSFVPKPVSKWFFLDWQYATDISRLPLVRTATLIIAFFPLLFALGLKAESIPFRFWLFWVAAVLFIAAWTILYIRCPTFVKEYRDFGQYKLRRHSHRWIVWEFSNNIESFEGKKYVVDEISFKDLCDDGVIKQTQIDQLLFDSSAEKIENKSVVVLRPVNHKRNIYLPFYADGVARVLSFEEDDPLLDKKEKELFWILFTQAVKERPYSRAVFWTLTGISATLVAVNVITNVFKTVLAS